MVKGLYLQHIVFIFARFYNTALTSTGIWSLLCFKGRDLDLKVKGHLHDMTSCTDCYYMIHGFNTTFLSLFIPEL